MPDTSPKWHTHEHDHSGNDPDGVVTHTHCHEHSSSYFYRNNTEGHYHYHPYGGQYKHSVSPEQQPDRDHEQRIAALERHVDGLYRDDKQLRLDVAKLQGAGSGSDAHRAVRQAAGWAHDNPDGARRSAEPQARVPVRPAGADVPDRGPLPRTHKHHYSTGGEHGYITHYHTYGTFTPAAGHTHLDRAIGPGYAD